MSCTRAYFPLLEVRHRVDPITINIPISTRFRVHIGTISLHGKVQMSSRGIARIPHVANNLPLGDILSYAYERRRLHMHIDGSQVRAAIARFRVCALDKNAVAHGHTVRYSFQKRRSGTILFDLRAAKVRPTPQSSEYWHNGES